MARPPATLEILVRLDADDVATLFRCATTCKGWRRVIAEPYFLLRRSRWPPSLVGFFTQRCLVDTFQRIIRSTGTQHKAGLRPVARAFAVRHSALSLELLGACWRCYGPSSTVPCRSTHAAASWYCDIVPNSDEDNSRPARAFKVIMVGKDKKNSQLNLHTIASGEASWRAPIKCIDTIEHPIWSLEHRKAVICRGYAHWLFVGSSNYFHILSYNVETESISFTKLLSPTKVLPTGMGEDYQRAQRAFSGKRLSTTAGGTLLSLRVFRGSQLEIWTHDPENGHSDAKWEYTRVIDQKLIELIQQLEKPYCIWEAERSGTLLILDCTVRRFYKANLDNGTFEEVTNQFRGYQQATIKFMEIDWPTFFMVRLGGP
ncbi:unnamed protein product [Alopecurus aequalis]